MSESQICILIVKDEDKNQFKRLDQFLAHHLKDHSRSFIKDLFLKGQITSEAKLEIKRLPAVGTEIKIEIPPPRDPDAQAENIPLEIIYEDEHLVFVNKPAGMVTHPAPGNYTGTLVNAILHHCPDLQGVGDQRRPGIVHRLDKGTSGIMVVAKNQKCHDGLVKLFSTHDIDRVYEALVMGTRIEASGRLESTIGRHPQNRLKMAANVKVGKNAITYYKALEFYEKFSRMEMKLETGRTHQIRVHLSQLLHRPILCDPLYGNPKEHLNRLGGEFKSLIKDYEFPFLHAKILGLVHPITKEKLFFEVDPPPLFQQVIKLARGEE